MVGSGSAASQEVALTIDPPPDVGYGPRLKIASMRAISEVPNDWLWKVTVCKSPHVQREGSFPRVCSNSLAASENARLRISSRVSTVFVFISSHQALSGN